MDKWQNHIDRAIEEAQERGEFELPHLRGRKLAEGSAERNAGERAMANKVLKNSGHLPPFLMKKQEIDGMLAKERDRLFRYARRRQRLLTTAESVDTAEQAKHLREQAEADWQWAVRQFEQAVPEINQQIGSFNLMNKIPKMHKFKIDAPAYVAGVLASAAEASLSDEPEPALEPLPEPEVATRQRSSETVPPALIWWLLLVPTVLIALAIAAGVLAGS